MSFLLHLYYICITYKCQYFTVSFLIFLQKREPN
nr:MAG TPA: hypothetical protein [Caudoviricetes sp.]